MRRFFVVNLLLGLFVAGCGAGNALRAGGPAISGERVNARDGYELVCIPAGEFLMGSPEGQGYDYEHPRHKVFLDEFCIGKYEVTVGQFKRYAAEKKIEMPEQVGSAENEAVVGVTWHEAADYCGWAGLRLPTEAEWEKSARAGTGTVYWWGDIPSHDKANYTGKAGSDRWDALSPIGAFPPNPYGLYDTAGGVWEWVRDWYGVDYYEKSPHKNPAGPETGDSRILRGGSWDSPADFMRAAQRNSDAPSYSSNLLGFRCAGGK